MTSYTINLPDALDRQLQDLAARVQSSVPDLLRQAAEDLASEAGVGQPQYVLSAEDRAAIARAREDFAEGRWRSHADVMADLDAVLARHA
jgi:predicted transcriptional regulator